MAYIRITDIDKYFKIDKGKMIFTGKSMTINVPKYYKDYNYYVESDHIRVLGILQLVFDDKYDSILLITTMLDTMPSDITTDDEDYIKLHYKQNDVFLLNTKLVQESSILYTVFMRFVTLGKIPKFITYNEIHKLFDHTKDFNGTDLDVGREIVELLFAYLSRDPVDPHTQYRLTKMKKDPKIIGVLNIIYAPQSTTSKLLGNYLDQGISGALLDDKPKTDDVEQMLLGN